jgi:hypothetical protein
MTDSNDAATSIARYGVAPLGLRLTPQQCVDLRGMFGDSRRFRSHIWMMRHGFGRGEYKYFSYPLPPLVQSLRQSLYRELVPLARNWLGRDYPDELSVFLDECHAQQQRRPTPLLLRYTPGDYNCLHQDLYGALYFPLQVILLLSEPGREFTGGEFVTRESRSSHDEMAVHTLALGEALAFATSRRTAPSARGPVRAELRHGVSPLRTGERYVLGIIFHDAA